MPRFLTAAALCALALGLAGCQVNVDNNTQASLSNAADSAGDALGNAADAAGNLAEKGAAKVENAADSIGNSAVEVNVHSDSDDNASSADRNGH